VVVGTFWTFMLNVTLDCPSGTTTTGDNPTAGCVLLTAISALPVAGNGENGTGPLNRIVPVKLLPPVAVDALNVNDVILTPGVRSASFFAANPPPVASIITSNENATGLVPIGNVADFAPAGTVMLAGMVV
jgi:hypothetical protein